MCKETFALRVLQSFTSEGDKGYLSQDSIVAIMTRQQAEKSGFLIPAVARGLSKMKTRSNKMKCLTLS
jgi:hypothetical protein